MSSIQPRYGRKWRTRKVMEGVDQEERGPISFEQEEKLINEATAAKMIPPKGVSARTMARYRSAGLIAYFRISGRVFYKVADIEAFVSSLRNPASKQQVPHEDVKRDLHDRGGVDGWTLLLADEQLSR
ncbi:MAG: helix-turn-helix domain-containing protein [Acidobacteria bacterium]|nr:helix-turn-helix domain-containing protein [Acidobacteriota bacterium]